MASHRGKSSRHYVYALYDPLKPTVFRYIGLSNDPAGRLKGHLADAIYANNTPKCRWIRGVVEAGRTPCLIVVCRTETKAQGLILERATKVAARERGHLLTNDVSGWAKHKKVL
ncbi:MAG: GIY-YIG nuclease family protein [Nitrospirales bacterium]